MTEKSRGVIYDVGYRPYEGPYLGRLHALASLIWDDLKRGLGVKKGWKYRAIIILLLVIELGVFFFFLVVSQLGELFGEGIPQFLLNPYTAFYETSTFVLLFLSALVAPNLLCDDRRYRVYPLYLARPIYTYDYLLAKAGAIFGILTLVTVGPALLLFLGKTLLAPNALDYLGEHQREFWALLAAGLLINLFYASFAMGISSLTTSRGYAAGAIIGVIFFSDLVADLLAVRNSWAQLLSLNALPLRVKDWFFFGKLLSIETGQGFSLEPLSPWIYLFATLMVMALSWMVVWLSYRREVR